MFPHVRDVKGRKVVERVNVDDLRLRTARRVKVPRNLPCVSGRLSYTPSVERVVSEQYAKLRSFILKNLAICNAHVRKHTRLSLLFRTASDKMLGGAWELG